MVFRAITLSGEVGSGKSSLGLALLDLLPGWERVNTGERFRQFCRSRGVTIQEVSHLPDEVHREFDLEQLELLRTGSKIIVEGRLAGWLARDFQDVFPVFCYAPLDIRLERYMRRDQASREKAIADIEYRDSQDILKFQRIYGLQDYRDPAYYNLQLDTSQGTPCELALHILREAGLEGDAAGR